MSNLLPSSYQLKKILMWPRTLFMRWKYRKSSGSIKSMMELHYYRPALFEFIGANFMNKNILHEADIGPDSVVVDVGAFTGAWAQKVIELYDPVIYAFEPNPQSFQRLEEKAAGNPKLRPVMYGLGGKDEVVDFTLKGLGSSMCDERSEHADLERIKVEIAAIDRAWDEHQLGQVDLMKINIEGAEFPLLERMIEKDLLKNVDCYLIQFHEWHPGAYRRRRKIHEVLSRTHKLEWDYHFVWEKWTRR